MTSSTSESDRAPPEPEGTDSPDRRAHPYDSNVRWMLVFPKCQEEVMRLTLDPVVYDKLDPDFDLQLLPTRVEGGDGLVDEADGGLLAQHCDGRSVLNVLEHKSDKTKFSQLQVISSAIRLTRQLVESGVTAGGEMPIVNAVVAMNGRASGDCPPDLAELANLSVEERAVTLTVSGVVIYDFTKVRLENLSKDPGAGMGVLLQKFGPYGPEPTKEEMDYLAEGLNGCTKDQKQYALWTLTVELGVSRAQIREAMARVRNRKRWRWLWTWRTRCFGPMAGPKDWPRDWPRVEARCFCGQPSGDFRSSRTIGQNRRAARRRISSMTGLIVCIPRPTSILCSTAARAAVPRSMECRSGSRASESFNHSLLSGGNGERGGAK